MPCYEPSIDPEPGASVTALVRYGDIPSRRRWERTGNLLPLLPAAVVPPVVALASGPPRSSGGVVRARMIRTWRLRRITGRPID
jgi:hypothetical protein